MEVSSFTGPMLALAGVVLQFAVRQFKLIPEIIYRTLVVMLGVRLLAHQPGRSRAERSWRSSTSYRG